MKYYVNKNTWIDEEDLLFQCKMAMFTKDCVMDAILLLFYNVLYRKRGNNYEI